VMVMGGRAERPNGRGSLAVIRDTWYPGDSNKSPFLYLMFVFMAARASTVYCVTAYVCCEHCCV
jgi:hypothetical protein